VAEFRGCGIEYAARLRDTGFCTEGGEKMYGESDEGCGDLEGIGGDAGGWRDVACAWEAGEWVYDFFEEFGGEVGWAEVE